MRYVRMVAVQNGGEARSTLYITDEKCELLLLLLLPEEWTCAVYGVFSTSVARMEDPSASRSMRCVECVRCVGCVGCVGCVESKIKRDTLYIYYTCKSVYYFLLEWNSK